MRIISKKIRYCITPNYVHRAQTWKDPSARQLPEPSQLHVAIALATLRSKSGRGQVPSGRLWNRGCGNSPKSSWKCPSDLVNRN